MDPQPSLSWARIAAIATALAACAAHTPGLRVPVGTTVLARGSLAYAVGFTADGRVVSIELEERFALMVRSRSGRVLGRHDLGPAERDLPALAIVGDTAWVGGADQRVRALGLVDGRLQATWPIGANVTALAATEEHVVVGEATGALCLRRRRDGALLHCVVLGDQPITAIAVGPAGDLLVTTRGRRHGLTVPALAVAPPPPADPRGLTMAGRDLRRDGVVLVHLGGPIRALAVDGQGRIAVAAWVATLTDPSVVLLPPGR